MLDNLLNAGSNSEEQKGEPNPTNALKPMPISTDRFLVCGLGSLGQYCVVNLKKFAYRDFAVSITAIDNFIPESWEIDDIMQLLAEPLIVDDCRKEAVLERAGVRQCRAILLVTSDESINIETAIAARRLNPNIHLVVRSSRRNLYQLLKHQLGDMVVLDPAELPAASFALAGLGEGTLGFFNIGDRCLRVVEYQVQSRDYRFDRLPAYALHKKTHLLLSFPATTRDRLFYQWQPDAKIEAGDRIVYIEEVISQQSAEKPIEKPSSQRTRLSASKAKWPSFQTALRAKFNPPMKQFWHWVQEQKTRPLIAASLAIGMVLWIFSAVLLKFNVPGITWQKAIMSGAILLLGGFGDVFGGLQNDPVPLWVQTICLLVAAVGILFLLGVLGLIADSLLSYRFESRNQRPPIPDRDHVVLVGLGSVGERVAALLQDFKQSMVVLADRTDDPHLLPQTPFVVGQIIKSLDKVNLATAKSIVVATEDQMLNLEVALVAHAENPEIGLVIRTFDHYFEDILTELLPQARSLCAYALSAEAFAGAAFGENILSLFCLNNRTILVAEYYIVAGDTLTGRMLAQIAYGYGVVPIFLKTLVPKPDGRTESILPSDDERLQPGDRLFVLATISGLRRIERAELAPPRQWQLYARELNVSTVSTNYSQVLHEATQKLESISGCPRERSREFLRYLPNSMELPLYDAQAYRLGQELGKLLTIKLFPIQAT
jgi:voltage-gated potassium channel Kch